MPQNQKINVPSTVEKTIADHSWDDEKERAYRTLYAAMPGDKVVWGDRSVGMTVDSVEDTDGKRKIEVEKPRADGTYTVRESRAEGAMKLTSPIGRADNLHFVERGDSSRQLTDREVRDLVDRLTENAVDAFMRQDYDDWPSAVADVVEDWADRVVARDWRGYKHDEWRDGDPQAIFRSVVETLTGEDADDSDLSMRERAELVLHDTVLDTGKQRAEASIISSKQDYRDLVEKLAHHTIDRIERKSYADSRVATRDTISDWIDDRTDPTYQSIIEHGNNRFGDDDEMYSDASNPGEEARQRAFDILDHDVWEEVQLLLRDRGDHDPTLRGMTRQTYEETVDHLAGQTLRRWDENSFLRTTAKEVVGEWADQVEAQEWPNHRHRTWAAGDVEDIFASVTIHSDTNPFVWNPFSSKKERKMAVQAMLPAVVSQAEESYDETQPESEAVPADEYMQDVLDMDTTYDELKVAEPDEIDEIADRITTSMTGDEVGWTFVDEIIEAGGVVPEATNDWVLVDYGVIREGEKLRKLAWFDRGQGHVLVLSGMAKGEPDELDEYDEPYEDFHVTHHEFNTREPEYVCQDVTLEHGLECVYEFVDGTKADIRVIETREQDWVQEQITYEDVNAGGVMDALVPNLPWGGQDILTLADKKSRGIASFTIRDWGPEMARMAGYTAVAVAPRWLADRLDGVRVEPNVHKHHGVGTRISKEFGDSPGESGIGGKAQVDLNVRPQTFTNLSERYAPRFVTQGLEEGDIGKGAIRSVGETVDSLAGSEELVYNDPVAQQIVEGEVDLDTMSQEELQNLAQDADREFDDDVYYGIVDQQEGEEPGTTLSQKLYGYAHYEAQQERVDRETFGSAFLDEYGGSVDSFLDVIRRGTEDAAEEEEGEEVQFSWDQFEQQEIGVSGLLMRGLDAEALVDGAEFFEIDDWLEQKFTFVGGDYTTDEEAPTYDEWKRERFGPGMPAGPEKEARMVAQYHKEVAAADLEHADPYEALGIDEERVEEGDWDNHIYDSDDGFGNDFDNVAERIDNQEADAAAQEFERSVDNIE